MKNAKKILFLIGFSTLILSCSTRKNTFINRSYHSITTKYNILFNGKEALEEGLEGIKNNYQDDYFKQLPIEPIEFDEDKIEVPKFDNGGFSGFGEKKENKNATPFDKAEEKAVKAIQLHSMNIRNREYNPQIDDAYLLLGKSRYYTQRFVPALEAFNYIIANYPNASLINETKIWRAKTNIRLQNEAFAIESLKLLLDVKKRKNQLSDEIREQGHTALAMAYLEMDSIQHVIQQLNLATRTQENENQAARNLFILGQIYSAQNKKDSATVIFNALTKFKKAPYKYKIHANIELAKNFPEDSSSVGILARLDKLIKNRDNRPYLDALYYQKALLLEKNDSISDAVETYNKSLRALNGSEKQKTYTYNQLGDLYFKNDDYVLASSYYDSVIQVAKEDDLRIRRVKRKYKNLASLIKNEKIVAVNDSVLRIASLPKEEQQKYFEDYIAKIKKEDDERAQQQLNQLAFGNSFGGNSLQSNNKGKWYFYNSQSVSFGLNEFQKVWGNRSLQDDWRWIDEREIVNAAKDSIASTTSLSRYDLDSYLKSIPKETSVIDSIYTQRNNSLFELGLIYKEQFKNNKLAINRLERLKPLNKDVEKILPINYNLYQLYQLEGNTLESNNYKEVVLNDYPESIQAQIIKNPNKEITEIATITDDVAELYKSIYFLYSEKEYEEVVIEVEKTLEVLDDSPLIPKFELLKAYAIGKYKDQESFKTALEKVAISYPNTEEGKKAQELIGRLKK